MALGNTWNLVVLASMIAVWLASAWMYRSAQRALPPARGQVLQFRPAGSLRWMGPVLILLGPGLLALMLFLVPIGKEDVVLALPLALFLGGISPVAGIMLMRARYRADDVGLIGYTVWGLPTFVAWHQVRCITFSPAMQSLRFDGGTRPLYVLVQLHDWPAFVAELERRLPHLPLPGEIKPGHPLRKDSDRLAFEGHWQGMYDHAGRLFWGAALSVALSLHILQPHPPALMLSALGGAGLALFPLIRRLVPKPRKHAALVGNGLQALGLALFVWSGTTAQHLHSDRLGGDAALSSVQWIAMIAQSLGTATLVMAALLLLAKWRWPERFARDRMGVNDWGEG
ncbi:hypothetical protein [Tepidimonas charontis]|uniref:Uncharacterized protein n=1 Tax=Tepidimonas charontis TaxID=2267262 RepID=A0A554X155_9BURK|nr:hypothetical protein [Tepidimonas charontis]TSE29591.1 hypothetical protein Tchar_02562 [Tepidimonas charontis]